MPAPSMLAIFILFSTPLLFLEAAFPLAKPNCNESCGNVGIPYPFGMTEDCSLNSHFQITCNYSYNPPQPFISDNPINVTSISLQGQLYVLKPTHRRCFSNNLEVLEERNEPSFTIRSFTINSTLNKFIAVGCDTTAFLQGYRGDHKVRYTTGCLSFCDYKSDVANGTCAGGGCCQTSIPEKLSSFNMTLGSFHNHRYVEYFNRCSYAFVVQEGQFNFSLDFLNNLDSIPNLPFVLDWSIGNENENCTSSRNTTTYACHDNTICMDNEAYWGYRCFCKEGYEGNPYLVGGCQDINECNSSNNCTYKEHCVNKEGSYSCSCPKGYYGDGMGNEGCSPENKRSLLTRILAIGIPVGAVALVAGCCWVYFCMRRREELLMKEKNLDKNGGKILKEKQKGSSVTVRTFTAEELKKATNNYHHSKVIGQGGNGIVYKGYLKEKSIGQGGNGTVYKGRLKEKREIAIKKFKSVDHDKIDQFINEVIVLSRIHHVNVVELLGCCLEDEVPLLVYEFISDGTLYEHLHKKIHKHVLQWDARLKIAAETASALHYLHSAASPPIIHRDVKTMNILLDENWTAKVADFGASRLVPLDESRISTMVLGTLGYLDPEYFQTSQLTEKSDVYSFGVVLAELLTGKVAMSHDRPEEERNLAYLFLSSLEQNKLVEVLDGNISFEERIEEVKQVAMLAERCLNVKVKDRPTMEEVSTELKGLLRAAKRPIQDADVHSEQIQPLLGEQSNALISADSLMTSATFGLEKDVILHLGDGR